MYKASFLFHVLIATEVVSHWENLDVDVSAYETIIKQDVVTGQINMDYMIIIITIQFVSVSSLMVSRNDISNNHKKATI